MKSLIAWPGYRAFHAAKKTARETGRREPTRDEFAATLPRFTPLLNRIQQAD